MKLSGRIHARIEDITRPMLYDDKSFDFIYTRLILHYLTRQELDRTLKELYRILKPKGMIFIVVRSKKDWETNQPKAVYNDNTCMLTYPILDSSMEYTQKKTSRYFHSPHTISSHLKSAGFNIRYTKEYKEQIFYDYMRTAPVPKLSSIIELLADK